MLPGQTSDHIHKQDTLLPFVKNRFKTARCRNGVQQPGVATAFQGPSAAHALATATGTVEWLALLMSEILDGPTPARQCREMLKKRPPLFVTDCKSLYDHLVSPSSPTAIEDRRTSIDVIIIRESAKATQAFVRWVPTAHMLADSLTKDAGEPVELLRVCLQHSEYQIAPESIVLERQAAEKERRKQARQNHQPSSE